MSILTVDYMVSQLFIAVLWCFHLLKRVSINSNQSDGHFQKYTEQCLTHTDLQHNGIHQHYNVCEHFNNLLPLLRVRNF